MNKTVAWTIGIVAILAGLGIWVYSSGNGAAPADQTQQDTSMTDDMSATTTPIGTASTTSNTSTQAGVDEFTVTGSNFAFTPNTLMVKKGDTVTIHFKNSGGMHDFKIDEFNAATKRIQAGGEDTITFVASKAGSFEYYCSVGSHRAMGMWGTLTVTE